MRIFRMRRGRQFVFEFKGRLEMSRRESVCGRNAKIFLFRRTVDLPLLKFETG